MNVSNQMNSYENKLTVVENKLRSLSGNEKLSKEEKAKETNELKTEKKQLQMKIDKEEDAKKKEELKEMLGTDEAIKQLSTVNVARSNLNSSINIIEKQHETDIIRGVDDPNKKEDIEKLNNKLDNFSDNIADKMSKTDKEKDKEKKRIFSDKEDNTQYNKFYKGTNYRKKMDIHI